MFVLGVLYGRNFTKVNTYVINVWDEYMGTSKKKPEDPWENKE